MSESSKNTESSKLSGMYLKDRRRHLDEGHICEKIYSLKNSRRAHIEKITENINKLMKYMDLENKSSIEFENCLQKLQKYKHKIKTVSDSLIELTNDPDELQNISDIYPQQDFRVFEISKSVSNYNASPLKYLRADDEQFSITSYSTKSKSKYGYEKPNFPSLPPSKTSSETSYLSVNEHRKTAEHTKLIVQQAEKSTKRKLDLLEQSFELEKQKTLDEELEAIKNAGFVALDSKIDELNRSKFESNCEKERENIDQKQLKKHDSLDVNTLKLKKNLTISEDHLPKTFVKSSPKPNKSNIKIKSFLTNTRTPVDSFIDNLVEE